LVVYPSIVFFLTGFNPEITEIEPIRWIQFSWICNKL